MKFNCGPTKQELRDREYSRKSEERKARGEWHRWFAWFPVRIGSGDCRWLEYVERYDTNVYESFGFYKSFHWLDKPDWRYRAIK